MKKFLILLFSLTLTNLAFADEFDCIRNLKGGTVRWDMDWQRDRADQDINYRIVNITESRVHRNLREIAIELLAEGNAKFPKRVSRIRLDYAAEIFCKRGTPAVKETNVLVRTSLESEKQAKLLPFTPAELPFRSYESGRLRAKRAPENVHLRVCATKDGLFSCTDSDYQLLLEQGLLKNDVEGRTHHEFPLIRFVIDGGGWVRGLESDLPRVGEISTCTALGRKFSCLTEEKNAFAQQLTKISERKI